MSTPAIIYIVLSAINLLLAANFHGKPRTEYNFWSVFIGTALTVGLLNWGGFFN